MEEIQIQELQKYIEHRSSRFDGDMLKFGDPKGKSVLVFGCGTGADIFWCAQRGAARVVGIDLVDPVTQPVARALEKAGIENFNYEIRKQDVHDLALTGEKFDLIVSNGVFEHVLDLKGFLQSFKAILRPKGRISIYADGLWYSSVGGHIGKWSWDHLTMSRAEFKEKCPARFHHAMHSMNRMTLTDFSEAIRSVGLLVLQLQTKRDPSLSLLREAFLQSRDKVQVSPTDMSISAIGCELCTLDSL